MCKAPQPLAQSILLVILPSAFFLLPCVQSQQMTEFLNCSDLSVVFVFYYLCIKCLYPFFIQETCLYLSKSQLLILLSLDTIPGSSWQNRRLPPWGSILMTVMMMTMM